MGNVYGVAPTWLRQVSPPPLLHVTTLTTADAHHRLMPYATLGAEHNKCLDKKMQVIEK